MDYSMVGPAIALGLSLMGSAIGCYIAGAASHAAMSRVEEGHGKFIGMSAVPSSQSSYGFVLMLLMKNSILANKLSPVSAIAIGLFVGFGCLHGGGFVFRGEVASAHERKDGQYRHPPVEKDFCAPAFFFGFQMLRLAVHELPPSLGCFQAAHRQRVLGLPVSPRPPVA